MGFNYDRKSVRWDVVSRHAHFKYERCTQSLSDGTQCADFKDHPTRSHRRPDAVWAWWFSNTRNVYINDLHTGKYGAEPLTFSWEGESAVQEDACKVMSYQTYLTKHRDSSAQQWFRSQCLSIYGRKCSNPDCKVTGYRHVEADHIDGDPTNNNPRTNGQVLCLDCHRTKTLRGY